MQTSSAASGTTPGGDHLPHGQGEGGMPGSAAAGPRPSGAHSPTSSGSETLAEGAPLQVPEDAEDDTFHDAQDGARHADDAASPAAVVEQQNQKRKHKRKQSQPAAAAAAGYRPVSYLFEDPHATPVVPIPEMQKLTSDVPARDQVSIILGPFVIIACDLVIPCIIYYVWLSTKPLEPGYDEEIMGYAVIPFGLGEAYILVVRVWRLIKYKDECAPMLSEHWWELDATSWIYAAALIAGLIPFVVGSALEIPELYLYSPGIYMAFMLFWAVLSLIPFKVPVRINSEPAGHTMRPLVYYAAEDFFAVDGWQKQDFRRRYRERYDSSIMFRKMIFEITIWWVSGIMTYIGCLSAVIWNNPFHIAFGLSLGVLFGFIIIWAVCTYIYVQLALEREREWWLRKKAQGEKA